MNVREQRQARRASRAEDPIGHASIQSVEDGGRVVHLPYSAEAVQRYAAVAASVEVLPSRWDTNPQLPAPVLLSLRSVIYRGKWFEGQDWCVRVDDVPESEVL